MKISRQKRVRKFLAFYSTNFGLGAPYSVLVDGTFCRAALKAKINIADQLPKYFESEVKMCTTSCCKQECKLLGALLYGPLKVLKQYKVVACGHRHPVAATRCLFSLAKQRGSYMVATQDESLSERVRSAGGIPLLFISHNAITLEEPSYTTRQKAQEAEMKKLTPAESELQTLQELKRSVFGEDDGPKKKKKKKGGPNPLSCKKKKNKADGALQHKAKRKRSHKKKVRIPEHVKEHLQTLAPSGGHPS